MSFLYCLHVPSRRPFVSLPTKVFSSPIIHVSHLTITIPHQGGPPYHHPSDLTSIKQVAHSNWEAETRPIFYCFWSFGVYLSQTLEAPLPIQRLPFTPQRHTPNAKRHNSGHRKRKKKESARQITTSATPAPRSSSRRCGPRTRRPLCGAVPTLSAGAGKGTRGASGKRKGPGGGPEGCQKE